jgi:hypothetical protein
LKGNAIHRAKLIVKRERPFRGADFVTAIARFWPTANECPTLNGATPKCSRNHRD